MLAVLSLLATLASSVALPTSKTGVLSFDVHYGLDKRNLPDLTFQRDNYLWVDLDVGSNHQQSRVAWDTGSSVTWFGNSSYDPHTSSTWHNASKPFKIGYIGAGTSGWYGSEQIRIHGTDLVLDNVTVAAASDMKRITGIVGAGPLQDDPNVFLRKLKSTGYINTIAFGVWINSEDGKSGKITVGGIDTTKFKGSLQKVPMVNIPTKNPDGTWNYHEDTTYNVNTVFNKISIQKGSESLDVVTGAALPACFDTGAFMLWLPKQWYLDIAAAFGAAWDNELGFSVTETKPEHSSITINFSGVDIVVDLSSSWVQSTKNGRTIYQLWLYPVDGPVSFTNNLLFGNEFQKFAYIVFDWDHREFAIAQAEPAASLISTSKIQTIAATGVDASRAPGYATSTYHSEFSYTKPTFTS